MTISPTRRAAWAVAVIAVAALAIPGLLAALLVAAVAVAVAVDAWVTRPPLGVQRETGDVLSRGVAAPLSITVADREGRATVRQPGTPDLIIEPSVAVGGLDATITPIRRGRHQIPAVASRVTGPLGLANWTRSEAHEHEVHVYPDMPAARRIAAKVRHGLFQTEGKRIRGSLGLGTSFESIRDYVDGDDLRRVNWMATARSHHPMVNQYRVDQDRDVICVIDCGRLMGAPVGSATRLDLAVDAAAAIGAVADVVGDRVGVVAFDDQILVDLPPHRRGGESVARAIYELEPTSDESDYLAAFERVAGAKRAFVLVLTDLIDLAAARPLVDALPTLARKHSVAVAGVEDPAVTHALRVEPSGFEGAARLAVAADVSVARSEALAAISRKGAQVVDMPVEQFSAACVGAYLTAKSRISF